MLMNLKNSEKKMQLRSLTCEDKLCPRQPYEEMIVKKLQDLRISCKYAKVVFDFIEFKKSE